ncbi:MAG: hypothetical protein U9Q81_18205 [Pseudomonadota bacterium]|nr:hypothetical protein [Pseudomonadota bacterium]
MQSLIRFFFELCLLRRAPQDLPGSSTLLGLVLVVDLLVGMLLATSAGLSPGLGLVQSLVDLFFMLALLYGALYLLDRVARFLQAATALLGSGALLGLIGVVPLSMAPAPDAAEQPAMAVLLFLVLVAWSVLVMGHILRHTFDLRLGQGTAIAVAYTLLAYSLVGGLFSGS